MDWKKINIEKYAAEIKKHLKIELADEILEKDLLLTLILAEFEKLGLGKDLIFKGGTLLSRNYLKYHRFSEDLDFVYKDSGKLRILPRRNREKKIKQFVDIFTPKLKEVADALYLEFSTDRSDIKFCRILHGRAVYTFKIYYSKTQYIKVEINFVEKMIKEPREISIKAITDFFNSEKLMFDLNLSYDNFKVLSYSIEEIILEKFRALLTRPSLKERDLFDLYLIPNSLKVNIKEAVEKIANSYLIKRELNKILEEKLNLLNKGEFFKSDEKISSLAIIKYNIEDFEKFKEKVKPVLIEICEEFLKKSCFIGNKNH